MVKQPITWLSKIKATLFPPRAAALDGTQYILSDEPAVPDMLAVRDHHVGVEASASFWQDMLRTLSSGKEEDAGATRTSSTQQGMWGGGARADLVTVLYTNTIDTNRDQ